MSGQRPPSVRPPLRLASQPTAFKLAVPPVRGFVPLAISMTREPMACGHASAEDKQKLGIGRGEGASCPG